MWNFVDLFYRNQGTENTGYATDEFLGSIAAAAGLRRDRALAGITSPEAEAPITSAQQEAQAAGIDSTPSFLVGEEAGRGQRLNLQELSFEAFQRAIEPELR